MSIWYIIGIFDFGIQWIGFLISLLFQTEYFYDITGCITYLTILSLISVYKSPSLSQKIQLGLILMWSIRLGFYLFFRVLKVGEDKRFRVIKKSPFRLFAVWNLQGIWVLFTLYPTLQMAFKNQKLPIQWFNIIGWSIFSFGFLIEIIADQQKWNFKTNKLNKNEFIATGVWKYCRHPNYLGEILLWFGMCFSSFSHITNCQDRLIAILFPSLVATLIIKLSGIPILERAADKRWGLRPDYQRYKKNTACLFPFLW